jgi:hypothetical protein
LHCYQPRGFELFPLPKFSLSLRTECGEDEEKLHNARAPVVQLERSSAQEKEENRVERYAPSLFALSILPNNLAQWFTIVRSTQKQFGFARHCAAEQQVTPNNERFMFTS